MPETEGSHSDNDPSLYRKNTEFDLSEELVCEYDSGDEDVNEIEKGHEQQVKILVEEAWQPLLVFAEAETAQLVVLGFDISQAGELWLVGREVTTQFLLSS